MPSAASNGPTAASTSSTITGDVCAQILTAEPSVAYPTPAETLLMVAQIPSSPRHWSGVDRENAALGVPASTLEAVRTRVYTQRNDPLASESRRTRCSALEACAGDHAQRPQSDRVRPLIVRQRNTGRTHPPSVRQLPSAAHPREIGAERHQAAAERCCSTRLTTRPGRAMHSHPPTGTLITTTQANPSVRRAPHSAHYYCSFRVRPWAVRRVKPAPSRIHLAQDSGTKQR